MLGQIYEERLSHERENIAARMDELCSVANNLESWAKEDIHSSIELFLSIERLDSAIVSYFYDITRYKHFHGMLDQNRESRVNFQKIYSYTTKWLLCEKPLYMTCKDLELLMQEDERAGNQFIKWANLINELWILTWIETSYKAHTKDSLNLVASKDSILYAMKYRTFSVDWFQEWLSATGKFDHAVLKQL